MTETEDKNKMGETETDASKLDDSADGVQEKGEKEKSAVKVNPFKNETVDEGGDKDEDEKNDVEDADEKNDKEDADESKGDEDLDKSDIITVEDNGEDFAVKKTISDTEFYDAVSEEEKAYYKANAPDPDSVEDMNVHCTACGEQVNHHLKNAIGRHPQLGVPFCKKCKSFYEDEGEWEKDEHGSECYCRWCANGGEMICCDSCTNAYCKRCITRNLGRKMFNQINDSDTWKCFLCDPKPIYAMRSLMYSISIWLSQRKQKLKQREREQKQKKQQAKNKTLTAAAKPDNFIDENINEAFDTLKIYQKCLEDERKRWAGKKRVMVPENAALVVSKLKKVYSITKQNMELLEKALLQQFSDHFPEEASGKYKSLVRSVDAVKMIRPVPGGSKPSTPSSNGQASKRKMKETSHLNSPTKKMKGGAGAAETVNLDDDDDIAVEEIVMNGEAIMGNDEFFNPAALCTIEITGGADERKVPKKKNAPAPPRIRPFKNTSQKQTPPKPTGPLRISSKMFKKKSPVKKSLNSSKERAGTPDSDVVEILSDNDDDDKPAAGGDGVGGDYSKEAEDDVAADSDVSLE